MPATALPPGPRFPRAIQTLGWMTRPFPFMQRAHEQYGDIFTMRIAQEGTWVFLAHPDMVKEVFKGSPKRLHAGEANAILGPVLGSQSVLLLDEESHMSQRKLLLPPFHGERMERYGELMREVTEAEIAGWAPGQPLEVWPRMQAVTLEIIMRAVFGLREGERLDQLRAALNEFLHFVVRPASMVAAAFLGPAKVGELKSFKREMRPVDELLLAEIRDRRSETDLEGRDDILSMLLQARHADGEPMSDSELRDELMTLLVAGHETTATSLAWAMERLVRHPDKLARLRDEIASGDDAYLDAVCKETLRLRPVLPLVVRMLTEPMEIGGYTLPAGAKVAPCIHLIHRRPDIYPDPAAFRPERFLESPAGTYTWIPFGGGVRRCIGATFALFEMRQVLTTILENLDLEAASSRPERVARRAITLTPGAGAAVVVRPRSRQPVPAAA
jgi:cytochrome P450